MDLDGLKAVIEAMHDGRIQCLAVDTTTPSAFAHEILNANPYAFLDDAPLEERRARAVAMRGRLPDELLGEAGRLSPEAIGEVREQIRPDIRDEHELHDLLYSMVVVPAEFAETNGWNSFMEKLMRSGRIVLASVNERAFCVATERVEEFCLLFPSAVFANETRDRMSLAG